MDNYCGYCEYYDANTINRWSGKHLCKKNKTYVSDNEMRNCFISKGKGGYKSFGNEYKRGGFSGLFSVIYTVCEKLNINLNDELNEQLDEFIDYILSSNDGIQIINDLNQIEPQIAKNIKDEECSIILRDYIAYIIYFINSNNYEQAISYYTFMINQLKQRYEIDDNTNSNNSKLKRIKPQMA